MLTAGERIADGFDAGLGERLRFGGRQWTVVGIFEAGRSGFESEIWGDVEQFMQAFRRGAYSSVILRLDRRAHLDPLRARIASDQRLNLEAQPETDFYAEQSEVMVKFLNVLGTALSLTFSLGAVMGAMTTMYASVAHRTAEIGTLRALGFQRPAILRAFLAESLCLALFGGALGLALASTLGTITVSTMNWQTFSELAFRFTMTFEIVAKALCFVLAMGLLGGFLPTRSERPASASSRPCARPEQERPRPPLSLDSLMAMHRPTAIHGNREDWLAPLPYNATAFRPDKK